MASDYLLRVHRLPEDPIVLVDGRTRPARASASSRAPARALLVVEGVLTPAGAHALAFPAPGFVPCVLHDETGARVVLHSLPVAVAPADAA